MLEKQNEGDLIIGHVKICLYKVIITYRLIVNVENPVNDSESSGRNSETVGRRILPKYMLVTT